MSGWLCVQSVLALVASAAVAFSPSQESQSPAPTFRAESHVVSFEFSTFRSVFGIRKPNSSIKVSEIIFVLDGKTYPPEELKQFKPGHYVVSFIPPAEYRDGKAHEVLFSLTKLKKGQGWTRTFTIPREPPARDESPAGSSR